MAPLTNEPDAIRVVLNVARRKAFYSLTQDITKYMRTQLDSHSGTNDDDLRTSSSPLASPPAYSETESPLSLSRSDSHLSQDDGGGPSSSPQPQRSVRPSPALIRLKSAALKHFDSWCAESIGKIREVVAVNDDQKVIDARRKRTEMLNKRKEEVPAEGEDLINLEDHRPSRPPMKSGSSSWSQKRTGPPSVTAFQRVYHPIPTRLTSIPLEDRKEVLSATMILLLSMGNYSAYSRTLICYLTSALEIPPGFLNSEETEIATTMIEAAQKAEAEKKKNGGMSADAETQNRKEEGKFGRYWKVGLASVAGAAIVGVTGGLAAPAVAGVIGGLMGSVGLGGLASFLGIFWMNGALVGTLFGAFGAKMTGDMIDQYAKEVEDFKFLPLKEEWGEGWSKKEGPDARRLRVTIGINGWLQTEDDVTKPWRVLGDESEVFALRYEMHSLMELGRGLKALVSDRAWGAVKMQILKRTVLATLQGALWPIFLLKSASSIDNPFSLARNRSDQAGKILADALINKVQGERPVTLVGYSLGARVIYSCLRVLAERKAFGLVDTVVLIGAAVPSNEGHWQMMRTVVSGKLFNVFSENDYILAFLYRSTSLQLGIAGLQPISDDVNGVENVDLSPEVQGHLRYPDLIGKILTRCGFPNVKGGGGEIEKEVMKTEEDIQLSNQDYAELGTLIDIDDGQGGKKLDPSAHTLRDMENEKFDPKVKDVTEQKSDAGVKDERLMGHLKVAEDFKTRAGAGAGATALSMPNIHAPSLSSSATTADAAASSAGRSASMSQVPNTHGNRSDDDDDYAEFGGGGGIKMEDHDEFTDDELTMVEPLSIEDHEPSH